MIKLTTDASFREAVQADELTVIVFKTTWCKDCHYIEPFMPELEQQYKGKAVFYEIDRDDLPDLSSELNILGIPSFLAFRKGQEVVRFVNKLRKSREEIEQFVDRALQVSDALAENQ
ncbi:thioredoxin family protein [Paenibacillus algorifonticola]|uniref:thioredoxin family protein n=1 Tax=Paenibacillus algorifonticola TaxID=684063 RepID=UPI003D282A8D